MGKKREELISRKQFMELCGGVKTSTLSMAIKAGIVIEEEGHLIDPTHPTNEKYIYERKAKTDAERIARVKGEQDQMSQLKLKQAREELRIKELVRQEKEGLLYPVDRFVHMKELYFTNAPKRVNQEHRNWLRVVAKKFKISDEDRIKLDQQFAELVNKTYQDELDALESQMRAYQS